ncbi:MAG TPA: class I SAM-dependent methyltransferase [Pseudonocardiaceae bacterium]|nr:class I SAM-dependent methyltransferase [Pseudonocardiaceae bacterium]
MTVPGREPPITPPPSAGATLSAVEQITLATYDASALRWSATHGDSAFWAGELATFQEFVPAGRLLDVGAGTGMPATLLCSAGYQVVGVDVSASMLALAAANCPRAEFHLASAYDLPFPDAAFDGAWLVASLLHLPKFRADEALDEVRRVVTPGGAVFVAVKRGDGEGLTAGPNGERYFAYYQPDELRQTLERTGLPVVRMREREDADTWLCAWSTLAGGR